MEQTKTSNPKRKIILAIIAVFVVLAGIYIAVNLILPSSIKSSYQSKNCEQVISLDSLYTSIYPAFMIDQTTGGLTSECALYLLAVENEEKKAWKDAYNTYQVYTKNYPKGLFENEVQEHSAVVLTAWAKDQLAAGEYRDAITNINTVLQNFGTTEAVEDATALMSEIYTTWAKEKRASSDFAGAEETLKTFKAWAESVQDAEGAQSAQRELADTYLAWGLAFQGQKQFEEAREKLELAISTDPEPLAEAGPAVRAKAAQAALYTAWGDTLVEKKDFTGAIDRYQQAVSFSDEEVQPAAKNKVASAYLGWASSLSDSEDFLGALKKIEEAGKNATTDNGKASIETAKADTYSAFSKSSGAQARQAMKDAVKNVCDKKKKPDLPIFALDKEHILAALYGVEDKLPERVAAKTPAELHYVACVELTTETLQKTTFLWATFVREKYTWNVSLRPINTGQESTKKSIEGGEPPPLPQLTRSNFLDYLFGGTFYRSRGSNPDAVTLANWLVTVMK